jgi:hypothetical protein
MFHVNFHNKGFENLKVKYCEMNKESNINIANGISNDITKLPKIGKNMQNIYLLR